MALPAPCPLSGTFRGEARIFRTKIKARLRKIYRLQLLSVRFSPDYESRLYSEIIMNRLLRIIMPITFALALSLGLVVAGCSSEPIPGPEGESPAYQLEVNLLGERDEFPVDSQGRLEVKTEVSSTDSKVNLSMDKGVRALDKDGKPLHIIQAAVINPGPLPSPEAAYIASPVYNLGPQGATFDPGVLFTLRYDPKKVPEGLKENALYIACYDGTGWCKLLYRRVDTKLHSVTTHLHDFNFTIFAVLGPKGPSANTPAPAQGTRVGNLAPDFQLYNLEGKAVSLSGLQGKPVMLNFWATWCGPCVHEMPDLQEVHEEWSSKGLELLAVNIRGNTSQVTQFLQSHKLSLPVLLDIKSDVARNYNIRGIPTTFFIDKDGIIQDVKVGAFPNKRAIEGSLSKIMP